MASWLAADNIKFFQQSEMRDIAVAHLARQYGFTEGQEKTVNGTAVATMDEFARAVAGEVQSVQDRIAGLTLKVVHNRDFAENNEKSPYEFGQTLVNIPVDSPLFKDALLGAALEQSAFAESFEVDELIADADPAEFDAIVLPGGVANPDQLRTDEDAVGFVRTFAEGGRPVAAICHAPWTLIESGVVAGRRLTSWPSLKTDLRNAGATWVDDEVVVDGNLITSRNPDDLPAFCRQLVTSVGSTVGSA